MERTLLSTALFCMGTLLYAQVPQAFNYQGVARDAGGDVLADQGIGVQFQFHQGTAAGTVVYAETHAPVTNTLGLFSLEVGLGTATVGSFAGIDWSAGPYFLEVGLDPTGGVSYTSVGTQQMMSVPYALYAETSGSGGGSAVFGTTSGVTSNENGTYATDDFVFGSTQLDDDGNTDHDKRFFFDKSKAAFRAGQVQGVSWNVDSIGTNSVAMGYETRATGSSSTALGNQARASGQSSTATGYQTTASGSYATAMGGHTTASAPSSVATGYQTLATGTFSTAMGSGTEASGFYSTALGNSTTASGSSSMAMGIGATASGASSTAMGAYTTASADASTATGSNTIASGNKSTAMGDNTTASGNKSTAMGDNTTASGMYSTALGASTTASGSASTAMGQSTSAPSAYETTIGRYNTTYIPNNATGWNAADRLFTIGKGTSDPSRSDAMVVLKNGNTGLGISAPEATLHVVGQMKYQYGTPANGRVLTSDASGNASWVDPASVSGINSISDADGNTKIQVEESPDEDIIRFDLAGTEVLRISKNASGYTLVETPSSGGNSTFFGQGAGMSSTTSQVNTFIGKNAGILSTTGNFNTTLGYSSGASITTGASNTLVGSAAGNSIDTGGGNTIVGAEGGVNSSSGHLGSRNTFLGWQTGYNNTGSGNIFIGYTAGKNKAGSDKLYIENSTADSANALIYGEFDNDFLAFNASVRINDGTQADGYVLTTDANGNATWTDPTTIVTATQNRIADADNDTRVEVEPTPDADIIKFYQDGAEGQRFVPNGMMLMPSVTGLGSLLEFSFVDGSKINKIRSITPSGTTATDFKMQFYANNTQAMTLDGGGSVWSAGKLGAGAQPSLTLSIGAGATGFQNDGSNNLQLIHSNVERVRFQNNGNVGIGTNDPQAKLHVNGQTNTGSLKVGSSGTVMAEILIVSVAYDLTGMGPNENKFVEFAVPGAEVGDLVFVSIDGKIDESVVIGACWVKATDIVEVKFRNTEGVSFGNGEVPERNYKFMVIKL